MRPTQRALAPVADPPPVVGVAISHRWKELWRYAVSEEWLKSADFQPEQYTMCIDGHMVQALVLADETATAVELDPLLFHGIATSAPTGA